MNVWTEQTWNRDKEKAQIVAFVLHVLYFLGHHFCFDISYLDDFILMLNLKKHQLLTSMAYCMLEMGQQSIIQVYSHYTTFKCTFFPSIFPIFSIYSPLIIETFLGNGCLHRYFISHLYSMFGLSGRHIVFQHFHHHNIKTITSKTFFKSIFTVIYNALP